MLKMTYCLKMTYSQIKLICGVVMALDHFYTIRERKKNSILDAIEKCMQTYDYDKLSINDIVNEADISRGSFYNYFADKSDAVDTLIKEKLKSIFRNVIKCINECDGNLFDGVYKAYNEIKDNLKNKVFLTIMKNLKFFIEIGTKIIYSKEHENELTYFLDWLINNTNEGKTVLNTQDKMYNVVNLLISIISNTTLKLVLFGEEDNNNHTENFDYMFNVIKKGVMNG